MTVSNIGRGSARLRYVNAEESGICRKKLGSRFAYYSASGKQIRSNRLLGRIEKLVIPPKWNQVWICRDARGHIQATGVDAKRRKQYLYHARWREITECAKFDRCVEFARQLPKIRSRINRGIRRPRLDKERVLATVMALLDTTLIRVGNEEYRKQNGSFGLTTLLDRHAKIRSGVVELSFIGKSGVRHRLDVRDAALAKLVKACQELPGQQLFQYRDKDGKVRDITSSDVNEHLRGITAADYSAKDFRTWAATRCIAAELLNAGSASDQRDAESKIKQATEAVAVKLGNSVTVCRKCYIHPRVLDAYRAGRFRQNFMKLARHDAVPRSGLSALEKGVVRLLTRRWGRSRSIEK